MKRQLLTVALTGIALVTSLAQPSLAAPVTTEPAPVTATSGWHPKSPPNWTACGDIPGSECATLQVPLDWSKPRGRTTDLAIGRLKALNPAKRIGVLVVHPGGPGGSGLNSYIYRRGIPDSDPIRQYFDLVTLDPRGVGRSTPVLCSEDLSDQAPMTYPATEQEYQDLLSYNAKLSQDCRAQTGPLFDHVDTTSASRDIDAIRIALGERQISFFAISYGTQVGQQYAELFPRNIRAMAIDSNMDHSITDPYQYLKTTTEDFEASFLAFAQWCGQTPACALNGQDVAQVWDDLHAKAESGQLTDPEDGQPIIAEELRYNLFDAMYDPTSWFDVAGWLKALAEGVPSEQAASLKAAEPVNNAYPAIWCSDWKWDVSSFAQLDHYRQKLEKIAPHTKISPFWSDVTSCLGWRGKVSNPQHRLKVNGAPPILVAKGSADVATPAAWNYAVAQQIPNVTVLENDMVGHGQFRNSVCAHDLIATYLIDLKMPAAGTRCTPEYPTEPSASILKRPVTGNGRPIHAG